MLTFVLFVSIPSLACASELSPKFFVAAWLVRIWLALASGSAIVFGIMSALDGKSSKHTLEPVLGPDKKVAITKVYKISYRKVGGGMLCAVFGCLLFVTSVFLLPDKRTGHSGLGKIITHFASEKNVSGQSAPSEGHGPSKH